MSPMKEKFTTEKSHVLAALQFGFLSCLHFLSLVLLSYYPSGQGLSGIIAGGSLMFLLGLIDDIFCLNAKFKLFIQVAIASIVIILGLE